MTVGHSAARDALDRAVNAYRAATPGSAALYRRASVRLPAGVTSNVKYFPPYPVYLTRAEGAHVTDVDGREYIDYCLAFGPLICGHGHPRVMAAVTSELARAGTTIFGAPTDLELRLAERIAALVPSAEMTRFTSSGTEATLHALRIARGATGRSRVIKFEGHYHGVHDHVLWNLDQPLPPKPASDGIPGPTAEQTIVVPFGDLDAVRSAFDASADIAAVIVEPVSRGVIHPERSFLQGLREITTRRGAVLIFDEVVAWPRVGLGGAQALYGVTPDLTTLGKAIGGGLPLGALVGRRELMSLMAPRASRTEADAGLKPRPTSDTDAGLKPRPTSDTDAGLKPCPTPDSDAGLKPRPTTDTGQPYVFHGGTYNGTPIAIAAGLATLNLLEEPGVLDRLEALTESLREGIREIGRRRGIAISVAGTGSVLDFYFTGSPIRSSRDVWASDLTARRALDYRLLAAGLYNAPVHRYHLSLAHTPADVSRTLELIDQALSE